MVAVVMCGVNGGGGVVGGSCGGVFIRAIYLLRRS